MAVEKRPLLIAAAVGAGILILLSAVNFILTYWATPAELFATEQGAGAVGCLSALACLGVAGLSAMTGGLYVLLTPEEMPFTTAEYAVGGAAAAGLANLINGLLAVCAAGALYPLVVERIEPVGGDAGLAAGALLAVVFGLTYLVLYAVMGALAGAAGAAGAAAWRNRRARPSP